MYDRTFWVDKVTDQNGAVIQEGTLLDQTHHNKIEVGISDASLAEKLRAFSLIQNGYTDTEETIKATIENNTLTAIQWVEKGTSQTAAAGAAPQEWPFNNSAVTIPLAYNRNTSNYTSDICVAEYSGGRLGNITVQDKALNGFKLLHDGSATKLVLVIRVRGGYTV
jgi:hypothetical protein